MTMKASELSAEILFVKYSAPNHMFASLKEHILLRITCTFIVNMKPH